MLFDNECYLLPRTTTWSLRAARWPLLIGVFAITCWPACYYCSKPPVACIALMGFVWLELELAVAPAVVDYVTCILLLLDVLSFDAFDCWICSPILF